MSRDDPETAAFCLALAKPDGQWLAVRWPPLANEQGALGVGGSALLIADSRAAEPGSEARSCLSSGAAHTATRGRRIAANRSFTPERRRPLRSTRLHKRGGLPDRIKSRRQVLGVHRHNPADADADRRERIWAKARAAGCKAHRHADERVRKKHACATAGGCRPGPEDGCLLAVCAKQQRTSASAGRLKRSCAFGGSRDAIRLSARRGRTCPAVSMHPGLVGEETPDRVVFVVV